MELWWYALVLLMLDNAQVVIIGQHEAAGRTWMTLRLNGDNEFDIVRPPLTDEMEALLREGVREIVAARRQRE
jgi:frataxin-like iron-binding protein CyaY